MNKKLRKNLFIEWVAVHSVGIIIVAICLLILTFLVDFLLVGWKNCSVRELIIFFDTIVVGSAIFTLLSALINCLDSEKKQPKNEVVAKESTSENLLINTLQKIYYTICSFIRPHRNGWLKFFIALIIIPLAVDMGLYGWYDSMFRMIVFISSGIVIIAICLSIVTAVLMIPINCIKNKLKDKKEINKNID